MFLHRTAAAVVCLLVATICGTAGSAKGSQLRLWPLLDYEGTADGWSLALLGPIFSAHVSSAGTTVTLRPMLSFSGLGEERHLTVLYPLLNLFWNESRTSARILGVGAVDRRHAPLDKEWRDAVRLPPLLYYRAHPSRRTSIAAFPVYGDLADVFGQHRIRTVAFPLFLQIDEDAGGARRTWAPFPFISVSSGHGASGGEIWPLVGWRTKGGETSTYALWPLYIARTRTRPNAESDRSLTLGPLHWREDSPTRWSRGYLGFGYTVDSQRGEERWDFPWPLWHFDRGADLERVSIPPFYIRSHTSTVSAGSILWPLYRWQAQATGGDTYARYELLLGLWRWRSESSLAGDSSSLHTWFPLFRHSTEGVSGDLATPAILDSLFPANDHIGELYAPLWQVFTRSRRGTRTTWRLLWGLLAADGERLQYPFEWRTGEPERSDGS